LAPQVPGVAELDEEPPLPALLLLELDCPPLPALLELDWPPPLCPPLADDAAWLFPPVPDEEMALSFEQAPHRSASASATVPTFFPYFMSAPCCVFELRGPCASSDFSLSVETIN
jgi:hypothetical protein